MLLLFFFLFSYGERMEKIFKTWDKNGDGFLERSEINHWRELTTHPSDFVPFDTDEEWIEYLKNNFGLELSQPKISLDQLFEVLFSSTPNRFLILQIQKQVDAAATYLGGNTLFTDIWHMLDKGIISDDQLVPHVVLKSECSICKKKKPMIDFRGITHDARGDGQWSKPDNERSCIDCEDDSKYRTVSRYFELNDVNFRVPALSFSLSTLSNFSSSSSLSSLRARTATKSRSFSWMVHSHESCVTERADELVGGLDYRGDGVNFAAKSYYKDKKVKTTSFFSLLQKEVAEKVEKENAEEASKFFSSLAEKCKVTTNQLVLILGDMVFHFLSSHFSHTPVPFQLS